MSNCWGQCLGLNNGFEKRDGCKYCEQPTCEECGETLTPEEATFYGHTCNECASEQ